MELLADENIETEWIRALREDGHDVVRVVDAEELGVSAPDPEVLAGGPPMDASFIGLYVQRTYR